MEQEIFGGPQLMAIVFDISSQDLVFFAHFLPLKIGAYLPFFWYIYLCLAKIYGKM